MMKHGYTGEFKIIDDNRAGKTVVTLTGRLNKCEAISLQFDVQLKDLKEWQNNLRPSSRFGFTVLTTSAGITDHEEVRQKHTGGKPLDSFPAMCCIRIKCLRGKKRTSIGILWLADSLPKTVTRAVFIEKSIFIHIYDYKVIWSKTNIPSHCNSHSYWSLGCTIKSAWKYNESYIFKYSSIHIK